MQINRRTERPDAVLEAARETLGREIEGLSAVQTQLGDDFLAAVALVAGLKGRLIVSGMGKSGHVAKKIAATLASTGTPSHFVHPGEASHGDLGMITAQDGLLMLSNSGETAELSDMLGYAKRFSIPVIALVRRAGSMLVESADIAIVLPEIPEASPTGAPTTSTVMMMAWGDALAMALLETRGFTKDDFRVFHPGGKLGQGLLRVADLMHGGDALPLAAPDASMRDVLVEITSKAFGCAGIVEGGKLTGIVTDGDLRRHLFDTDHFLAMKASEVMTVAPVTIGPRQLAAEAVAIMNAKTITALFALDDSGAPVGILHLHDCLRAGVA